MSNLTLTIDEINTKINEYECKLEALKKEKIKRFNFIKYFNISKEDVKKYLENDLSVDVSYEYNDHAMDEFGHDASAHLKVTYDSEYLKIDYEEQQGEGTESRYNPTIECEINGTDGAINLLFKNLDDVDVDDYEHEYAYIELRNIIENIATK